MKKSSLQLEHYHYTKLLLEVNADYQADKELENSVYFIPDAKAIKTTIRLQKVVNQENTEQPLYALELNFSCDDATFPYVFSVGLMAFVMCEETLAEEIEQHQHRLVVNAVSMLFSAVREQLLMLSARHQYGPMMLPSLDFRSLAEQKP